MEIEKIISQAANKFERCQIKSNMIKIVYFLLKNVFSVWFLSIFFFIPNLLFKELQTGKKILLKINQLEDQDPNLIIVGNFIVIGTLVGIMWCLIKIKKQIFIKISSILFLLTSVLINIITCFNLIIITNQKEIILNKILSIITILVLQIYELLRGKFFISFSFETQNDFSHLSNQIIMGINLIEKITFYFLFTDIIIYNQSLIIFRLYYAFLILINLVKIVQYFKQKYFINETMNYVELFFSIISLTLLLLVSIYQLSQIKLLKQNIVPGWIIISAFSIMSAYSYLVSRKNQYIFQTVQDIISLKIINNYLQACYLLWKNSQAVQNSLIVSSIRKNHQFSCKNVKCYCLLAKIIQQKNNSLMQGNKIFFKGYFNQNLQILQKQIKGDKKLFLRLLYFKFQIFHNYINISRQINKQCFDEQKDIELNIGKYILQKNVQIFVQKNNTKTDNVNIELPMRLNKVIQSMQTIIFNDIYVRSKKWDNLSKDVCKTFDIQQQIHKEIEHLKLMDEIFTTNKFRFQKSLAFNSLCFFYYGDIAFIGKQLDSIQQNLRELKTIIKYYEIVNNKQLSKNILDSRCCLIQFDLSKNQVLKNGQLTIVDCSDNVKNMFKYDKNKLLDEKMQILFPKFLWENQKKFILDFLNQTNQFQHTEACDKYYVDKQGHVFQALTSMKMIPKNNGISLILLIFQKETKNIVLLNSKGLIEGVGETFTGYFGKIYQQIPFSSFFYFDDQFSNIKFTQKIQKNKFILIDGNQIGSSWLDYLQNIKYFLKKHTTDQKIKSIKENNKQRIAVNKQFTYSQQIENFLQKEKKQLIRSKLLSNRTLKEIKQTKKSLGSNIGFSILSASLNYRKCQNSYFEYFVFFFDQIKRKKSPNAQTQYTIGTFNHFNKQKKRKEYEGTLRQLQNQQDNQRQLFQQFQNQQNANSIDLQEELRRKQRQKQLIYHQASSVQSSLNTASVSFFYYKFIEICFDLFKNPSNITDRRLTTFTWFSVLMAIVVSCVIIVTYWIFSMGLYQVKDIFFADGAVSDNMQLTQFLYNRAMNFIQFKENSTELQSIFKSSFYEREYLYGLTVYDLANYLKEKTSMTSTKFYEYITVPISWKSIDNKSPPITIQTNQFLTYYYHLSREVEVNLLNNTVEAQHIVKNALDTMRINFPQLKRINHQNLYLYQKLSDNSLDLLRRLNVILGIVHAFLTLVVFYIYYKQKIFRRNQMIEGFSIYKLIPQKVIELVSNYYNLYCRQIKKQKDLVKYETHYDRFLLYLPIDKDIFVRQNKNKFITNHSSFTPSIWKMLVVVILVNVAFAIMLIKIKNLFQPIQLMMSNVNNLMDSQNYLLQSYFDMKSEFIIQKNFNASPDIFDDFLQSQLSVEVLFNKISVQSFGLFQNYDSKYKQQFLGLLINDVCQLAKDQVQQFQYKKCISYFKIDMIGNGVMLGMNFFTRKTRQTILMMKQKIEFYNKRNKTISQVEKNQILDVFKSQDFRQIDESIIYMFKMYQATQARIYTSLQQAIIDIMKFSKIIVVLQILIVAFLYPVLIYLNFKWQKQDLSKLYVSFLLIPSPLAKILKTFSGKIEQILEYQKSG